MTEYYFDIETTGTDFDKDEIITLQWQEVDRFTGAPIGKLNILKRWESSEEKIIREFQPNLTCHHWDFVFIGKNLSFDFCILNERLKHFRLGEIDLRCLHERASLDIKPILVMMNNGFVGYDKLIPKTNPITGNLIPELYKAKRYPEIVKYVEDEAGDFLRIYQVLKKELGSLRKRIGLGK